MKHQGIIGVDVGGTKISVGKVMDGKIVAEANLPTLAQRPKKEVIGDIIKGIEQVMDPDVIGIGIGVPGLLDAERGIVYDVTNIPAWKEAHVKEQVEAAVGRKVYMTNDANSFIMGEKVYGRGATYHNLVGLALGTGVGAGIIANDQLCAGIFSIAGEVGSIPYLTSNFEDYCSGKFFAKFHGITGKEAHDRALAGDVAAQKMFDEYGEHIANLISIILYSVGPELVVLGGSGAQSFCFFEKALHETLRNKFPFKRILDRLSIEVSTLEKTAVLGAAALVYQKENLKIN
jgi:glucokinase